MGETCNKNILVLGDVMIDIAWVIRATDKRETSQFHGGCIPQKILESGWKTEMLGGTATVARRIFTNDKFEGKVTLAGAWSNATNARIKELIPEYAMKKNKNKKEIEFVQLFNIDHDTLKWRIFSSAFEEIKLEQRFDRDFLLKKDSKIIQKNIENLLKKKFSSIIVDDFNKGLLDHPKIITFLKKYKGIPFLLRPKRRIDNIIKNLPWTILMPNRNDFAYLVDVDPLNYDLLKKIKNSTNIYIHPKLLDYLNSYLEQIEGNHPYILVKLDKEGALLFDRENDKITVFSLTENSQDPRLLGIGAGDVLMAELAVNLTKENKSKLEPNNLVDSIKEAVKFATIYCFKAKNIIQNEIKWYGRIMDFKEAKDSNEEICFDKEPIYTKKNIKEMILDNDHPETAAEFLNILANNKNKKNKLYGPLRFHRAQWYLGEFLTVDKGLGSNIELYRREFENYIAQDDKERKPFVVALCGEIGSGKSLLAKNFATITGCEFIESNAGQWTSFEDLFLICEQIRSIQICGKKIPFVFIDEVDSCINGQPIYGKLIAPIWDSCYTYKGFQRELGPAIYVLTGSNYYWKNENRLIKIKNESKNNTNKDYDKPKLRDLVSRFRLNPFKIPSLINGKAKSRNHFVSIRTDAIYIAANHIKSRFPNAKKISVSLLRLLSSYEPRYEARSIVQAIYRLDLIEKNFKVALSRHDFDISILDLYFLNINKKWKEIAEDNNKFVEIDW